MEKTYHFISYSPTAKRQRQSHGTWYSAA